MSEPDLTEDETGDELEPILSGNARVEITVGTQFTYRGNSHWPKVLIADGPLVIQGDGDELELEDGESLLYRTTEIAHRTLAAIIARMKAEIDHRAEQDQAARTSATNPR